MARVILHSDDFGLHPAINEAIVACARSGVLSSTSLLANGEAAEAACVLAKSLPNLGIGLHLNIVRGRPLSPPDQIASIVDKDGRFLNSMPGLLARSHLGRLRVHDIYTEYKRQVVRALDGGIVPSHFDAEKHSHVLLPQAAEALARIAAEFAVKKVRRISERPLSRLVRTSRRSQGYWRQHAKLWLLERGTLQRAREWRDLRSPDYSFGVAAVGCPDTAEALAALAYMFAMPPQESVEWFFHVGNDFDYQELQPDWGTFWLTESRKKERDFLLSSGVRAMVDRHRDQLISYRDLG